MIVSFVALALWTPLTQQPPTPPSIVPKPETTVTAPAPEPLVQAWKGSFEEGFTRLREHAAAQQFESARAIADQLLAPTDFLRWKADFAARGGWRATLVGVVDPVLDEFALNGLPPSARAEVTYARGVVNSLEKSRDAAAADFERVRGLARDRSLRHDAIYDLGVLALETGEEVRATIPEVSGRPPAPPAPVPAPPSAAGAAPTEPPDPIEVARAAYLRAREHFVERLKSAWDDADTQANVELCLKRLRELDEIERQREEEQKKQEEQKQQDPNKQDQKQDQKPDKQDSKEDPKPGDQQEDPKPEEKQPEEQQPETPKEDEKKPEEKPKPPPDPKEAQMSREEMTQLLDRLKQLEEEHAKIQAQLKAARRGKVKKDW
ncbi:MAG: hypothetical protein JNL28_10500 [Planctomycetes bacterium]|nr:hypothetical protein [Planctomycetota bacterium]